MDLDLFSGRLILVYLWTYNRQNLYLVKGVYKYSFQVSYTACICNQISIIFWETRQMFTFKSYFHFLFWLFLYLLELKAESYKEGKHKVEQRVSRHMCPLYKGHVWIFKCLRRSFTSERRNWMQQKTGCKKWRIVFMCLTHRYV